MKLSLWTIALSLLTLTLSASTEGVCADYWIYFGTVAERTTEEMDKAGVSRSEGVYVGKFDSDTGSVSDIHLAIKADASSYLAPLPGKDLLYFIGAIDSQKEGSDCAVACKVDPKTGNLTAINSIPSKGRCTCHTSVRPDGKFLTTANYISGDFSIMRLNKDGGLDSVTALFHRDGSGPLTRRQDHAYGHSSYFVESDGICRVFMSDLGADKIYIARLNEETGALEDDPEIPFLAAPAGAGPRHLDFTYDVDGNLLVFSINELDSTLSAFRLNFGAGTSELLGTWSTLEDEFRQKLTDEETLVDGKEYLYGNKTAAIAVARLASGKTVVYASNRGQDTVVAFDADAIVAGAKEGAEFPLLQRVSTNGGFPRFFMLDPTNKFLIVSNEKSGSVYTYKIDQETGLLSLTSTEPIRIAWCVGGGFMPMK